MEQDTDIVFTQALSGWVNRDIMDKYLRWLSNIHSGFPPALIMDSYACNYCENVMKIASDLMIEIILIPSQQEISQFEFP